MTTIITLLILRRPFFALVRYPALAVADGVFAVLLGVWLLLVLGSAGFSPAAAAGAVLNPGFLLAVAAYVVLSRLGALAWVEAGRRRGRYSVARHRRLVRGLLPATALVLRGTVLLLVVALGVSWAELLVRSLRLDEWQTAAAAVAVHGVVCLTFGQGAASDPAPFGLGNVAPARGFQAEALGSLGAATGRGLMALGKLESYALLEALFRLFLAIVACCAITGLVLALLWRRDTLRRRGVD